MKLPASRSITACFGALLLLGCGGGGGSAPGSAPPSGLSPDYEMLTVAKDDSAYRQVLVDCLATLLPGTSCTLATLPLLVQDRATPGVEDIMARTVVSHAWMGDRFRAVLQRMPAQILELFRPVTGIVIASDIRPSFYSGSTAAIYLDPAHLWVSNSEKSSISTEPDYRSEFGQTLPFVSLARYVEGSNYAWDRYELDGTETRTVSDIVEPLAALLFHELAHANDAIPPVEIPYLTPDMSAANAVASISGRYVSDQLDAAAPLISQLMMDLASVLYRGNDPTPNQLALSAEQVGLEFESDGATDDYAYHTSREDLAMLVEEVMMHHHYGISREIAYTDAPPADEREYCDGYIVRWGFRNRIGEATVKSRAEMALQLILDEVDVSRYLDSLPSPRRMPNNTDWCTALFGQQNSPATAKSRLQSTAGGATSGLGRPIIRPDDRKTRHR